MRRVRLGVSFAFVVASLVLANLVQAASPSLSIILPRGLQRGAETTLTFSGARLADTEEVLFYSKGFTVTKIEPNGANQLKVTIKVDPKTRCGEHVAQVRTKSGLSDYRSFYVGPYPDHAEVEPNTQFEAPQAIPMNVTVSGVVQNEDVDYYVVEAKKGQRVSAEVEGMRLGTYLFDPYVAILDSKRFELSSSDDAPLAFQDAIASVIAPEDGKYYVEVRESAYAGNGNCRYRLHVGHFPRPTAVYPAGGKKGEEVEVAFLGAPGGEFKQKFKLPTEDEMDFGLEPQIGQDSAPSQQVFRLFDHGNAMEKEPNNGFAEATPAELPLAFNGIIQEAGDVDMFKFTAKKGQVFDIECYARRVRSALDPVMNLYYANGRGITGNDDSRGPDSFFRVTIPADGEYVLRVTDHLGRGGKDYVYRIELTPPERKTVLGIPRVSRYSQYRQWLVVPRGNKFATLISASRRNFGGELVLNPQGMPAGLTIHAEPMASNLSVMPVVIEAAADAPLAGALVDFTARHVDENQKIPSGYENLADYIRGGPGQSIYWRRKVDRLAVAVVEEVPYSLEIVQPKVPLVRNGSMQLKIVAHKKEGWDEQINVQLP
ncbi:MAG: peptidase, partial [Planctomycetaceae bacterium]|nr:peptidase [Planctomycetaceae bacterium]